MARYSSLNATLETLDERLKMLEVKDKSHFLGFSWPTTDGLHTREKWMYNNWDELIERFVDESPVHVTDITGDVRLTVIEPITSIRETRYVTKEFSRFVQAKFQRANEQRNKEKEMYTEKGYKASHKDDDVRPGSGKDTGRKWGYKSKIPGFRRC
jgi:hypothetical protein